MNLDFLETSYVFPPINLLRQGECGEQSESDVERYEKMLHLEKILHSYGIRATVLDVFQGTQITRYHVRLDRGVRIADIKRISSDIALNLYAKNVNLALIPGESYIGIEVEADSSAPVFIRDLLESDEYRNSESKISFAVGKDRLGRSIVANLEDMPHLLIAGTTGSGKSTFLHSILASFLHKAKPSELKLIMIDTSVVELARYNKIPHMLTPVITDARLAARSLAIAVQEMDRRYELFSMYNVKSIKSFNEKMVAEGRPDAVKPRIVIIIDGFADLMDTNSSDIEYYVCRIAQKARAAGIHLILATQRPTVDVVTGLIKANFPSRISFNVSSNVDSRVILGMSGAETLHGKGDMLFSPVYESKPIRIQAPFISDEEVNNIINFIASESGMKDEFDEELFVDYKTSRETASHETAEYSAALDFFNSLPESIRKQILDS